MLHHRGPQNAGLFLEQADRPERDRGQHGQHPDIRWPARAGTVQVADGLLRRLAIKAKDARSAVGNLSGGNQQKVVLAKWLDDQPRVLIFDEPTRGIDVGAKAEIYQLMIELAKQGMAILMISSELPEVLGMSDRVWS